MAKTWLTKKERKNYYETKAICEPCADYCYTLSELTDEEVSQISALKKQYGEDFINHLESVFDDPDVVSDLFYGDGVDIDTENVYHQYRFTIHEVDGEKVRSRSQLIQLSDENYAKLLAWHLFDQHLVINTLFHHDEALCKEIMRKAIYAYSDEIGIECHTPFVITMDEALADAKQMMQEHNIPPSDGYRIIYV